MQTWAKVGCFAVPAVCEPGTEVSEPAWSHTVESGLEAYNRELVQSLLDSLNNAYPASVPLTFSSIYEVRPGLAAHT